MVLDYHEQHLKTSVPPSHTDEISNVIRNKMNVFQIRRRILNRVATILVKPWNLLSYGKTTKKHKNPGKKYPESPGKLNDFQKKRLHMVSFKELMKDIRR